MSNVYEQGNARRKEGDDYPARIYVAFEFEPDEAGFFERAKRKTVEVVFGEELPGSGIGERAWHKDTGECREVATQGRANRFTPLSPKTCQGIQLHLRVSR